MARMTVALGGAALALLIVSTFATPADARRGGAHGWSGARHHTGAHIHSHHRPHFRHHADSAHRPFLHHRRVHRRVFVGAPFVYGAYYYDNGCSWLRQRALYTGSPYWWNRYYACINGTYD